MNAALSIAIFATTPESDKPLKWKLRFCGGPVIASRSLGNRDGNPGGGRRLWGGP